jgi:membrane-bound serine protease (ClpP class)
MRRIGLCAALLLLLVWPVQGQCIQKVEIGGVIHPVTVDILERASAQAKQAGCTLLLITLNTPGGFADATRRAVEVIVSSGPPVAAFVAPSGGRAASAGVSGGRRPPTQRGARKGPPPTNQDRPRG